jgi:hypothetical protein
MLDLKAWVERDTRNAQEVKRYVETGQVTAPRTVKAVTDILP